MDPHKLSTSSVVVSSIFHTCTNSQQHWVQHQWKSKHFAEEYYFRLYCAACCVNPVVQTSHPHKAERVWEEELSISVFTPFLQFNFLYRFSWGRTGWHSPFKLSDCLIRLIMSRRSWPGLLKREVNVIKVQLGDTHHIPRAAAEGRTARQPVAFRCPCLCPLLHRMTVLFHHP